MNHKNRGMFLESIINKTIKMLDKNNIALFHKQKLDISFSSTKIQNKKVLVKNAYIAKKSTIDYFGIYQGIFVAFEVKSTEKDYLSYQNIKEHQHDYLKKIISYGGVAFYIICFKEYNEFYIVDPEQINLKEGIKQIKRSYCKKHCYALILEYPGIVNIIEYIDSRI